MADPDDLSDVEVAAWDGMLKVHSRLMRALDARLRSDHGVTVAEYDVVVTLWYAPGGLRMSELADRVVLSPSRMTRRVEALERRGLVARRTDPVDARAVRATVTAEGRRFLRRVARSHHEVVRGRYLDLLTDRERRMLGEIWDRMLRAPLDV